ncbi:MAG TPA: response regulator transcription factor [Sphingobacteriaceae bacterium]|nr:response regulator transcription factor [Sphingobacteriaceae bacterium]
MNVLITDDHDIVRLGSSIVIQEIIPGATIHQATDFAETINMLSASSYDLLLLDINMPGGNNIKMIDEVLKVQPSIKILVFSSYEESIYALRYLQAGASGFINKNSPKEELKNAILSIIEKGRYMSPEVSNQFLDSITQGKSSKLKANPLNSLSNREMDVAKFLVKGLSIIEVSKEMNLKNSTISTYKTRIFDKLQIDNIADLIDVFRLHSDD